MISDYIAIYYYYYYLTLLFSKHQLWKVPERMLTSFVYISGDVIDGRGEGAEPQTMPAKTTFKIGILNFFYLIRYLN